MTVLETSDLIALGGVVVGAIGLIWGVYSHYSNRKTANLFYEINQLSDYEVPESFVAGLATSLISIRIVSEGNAQTKDIVFELETISDIQNCDVVAGLAQPTQEGTRQLLFEVEKLNPSQEIRLLIYCAGSAIENQVQKLSLTHASGIAIDRKARAVSSIDFSIMGIGLTYNLGTRSIGLRL